MAVLYIFVLTGSAHYISNSTLISFTNQTKPYQTRDTILHKIYTMCFGSSKTHDPYWWGYIDDGQGWTARPKSAYMKTPEYNPELRRKLKKERKERKQEAKEVEKRMRREWLEGSRVSKKVETG